jgi:hypothetical protein
MKNYFAPLLIASVLFSCTKPNEEDINHATDRILSIQPESEWYRVSAIGSDTTSTRWMQARTEAYSYSDSDDYLSAKVVGYSNGQYIVEVKNKQTCGRVDLQFSYESLSVTAISPNPNNSIYYNSIGSGATQLFYVTAKLRSGKIKVKALTVCNWCGENPEWLKLDVNEGILPITFLESKTTRDAKTGKVTVSFSIDDPLQIDWYLIERMKGAEASQAALIAGDKTTKSFTIKL